MFGWTVNMAKDIVYPPYWKQFMGFIHVSRHIILSLNKHVWIYMQKADMFNAVNGPLLMETVNKSIDIKFSYLVLGCAAILRGAEPISLSSGVYQNLWTHISNPWIKKKITMIQISNHQWELFSFLSVHTVCMCTCTFEVVIADCKKIGSVCGTDGRAIALAMVVTSILGPTCRHVCPWAKGSTMSELLKQKKIKACGELLKQHSLLHCPCYKNKERQSQRQTISNRNLVKFTLIQQRGSLGIKAAG